MATDEVTEKELASLEDRNRKVSEEIAEKQRILSEAQFSASRRTRKAELENQHDSLKRQLEELKADPSLATALEATEGNCCASAALEPADFAPFFCLFDFGSSSSESLSILIVV